MSHVKSEYCTNQANAYAFDSQKFAAVALIEKLYKIK